MQALLEDYNLNLQARFNPTQAGLMYVDQKYLGSYKYVRFNYLGIFCFRVEWWTSLFILDTQYDGYDIEGQTSY